MESQTASIQGYSAVVVTAVDIMKLASTIGSRMATTTTWVNNDGLYIATDNPLFDPRNDQRINGENWTRFVKE